MSIFESNLSLDSSISRCVLRHATQAAAEQPGFGHRGPYGMFEHIARNSIAVHRRKRALVETILAMAVCCTVEKCSA